MQIILTCNSPGEHELGEKLLEAADSHMKVSEVIANNMHLFEIKVNLDKKESHVETK